MIYASDRAARQVECSIPRWEGSNVQIAGIGFRPPEHRYSRQITHIVGVIVSTKRPGSDQSSNNACICLVVSKS